MHVVFVHYSIIKLRLSGFSGFKLLTLCFSEQDGCDGASFSLLDWCALSVAEVGS